MPKIAFATYSAVPKLQASDQQLVAPLQARGYTVEAAAWDDPAVDWTQYRAVVVRSTWDYHNRPLEFAAWIDRLQAEGVCLLNPPQMLRWNMSKTYLRDLAAHGVATLPTVFVEAQTTIDLGHILMSNQWANAIIKPVVSAGAQDTWLTTSQTAITDTPRLAQLLQRSGVMIQPFADAVSKGEYAIVFFNGIYSHTLLKIPAEGSIFVHVEHGGRTEAVITPPPSLIQQAATIVRQAQTITGQLPVYARVDGLWLDETLVLMELELIEPELFLTEVPLYPAERFADAISHRLC